MQVKIAKHVCFLLASIFLLVFIAFNSCKKVSKSNTNTITGGRVIDTATEKDTFYIPPQLLETVTSSISGYITGDFDPDGRIEGASITFGNKTAITDESGYFEIKDATVSKLAAQISASKAGYLTSFKTFITAEGESNFERLRLVNTVNKNYNSSIDYSGSFAIDGTNTQYSGYQFYSGYEMWKDNETNIPGDSRGIDSAHHIKLLNSYGICAFYSLGNNGEKLQIERPAIIKMTAVGISFTPPATIPVWWYDEKIGLWREVGIATFDGQSYETTISKLGIYNFAVASDEYNVVSAKLVTANGEPLPFTAVTISKQTDPVISTSNFSYTDANGFIRVAAPVNSSLSLNVFPADYSDPVYPEPDFSKKFNNAVNDFSLQSLTINTQDNFTVNGTLFSCNGSKISDGFVELNYAFRIFPDANGHFHFSTLNKYVGENTTGLLTGEENSTKEKSDQLVVKIVPGVIVDTSIIACSRNGNVQVIATLVDNNGKPLPDLVYSITAASFPQNVFQGISNSEGMIKSEIYENTTNTLSVYGSANCGNAIYTKSFTTTNADIALGNLLIPTVIRANITGTAVDCNNNIIKSGSVVLVNDQRYYQSPLKSDGTFNFSFPVCNSTARVPISINADDGATLISGSVFNFSVNAGNNDVGKISVCHNNSDTLQFINYTLDSMQYSYISSAVPFNQSVDPFTKFTTFSAGDLSLDGSGFYFQIQGSLAVGASQLAFIELDINPGYDYYDQGVINITEYGSVGGFIAGNMKFRVQSLNDFSIHDVTCSFRIKRKQ